MLQFAVWGCGTAGKMAGEVLGKERIIAYIDNDSKIQGAEYQGRPIVSYAEYQNSLRKVPIIITPKGYEEEIMGQMDVQDQFISYKWREEKDAVNGFLMQAPMEKIMEPYKGHDRAVVYGDGLLSIIITFFFRDQGYDVHNVFPRTMDQKKQECYEKIFEMNPSELSQVRDSLILAQELQDEDKVRVQEKGIITDSFYDIGLKKYLYYNPAIEKFKDIHKNGRCFIIATGPSLRTEDLDTLHARNEVCISMNGIFKAFDKTKWRPDYYVVSDIFCTMAWRKEILELDVKEKFISDLAWIFRDEEVDTHTYKWHLQLERYTDELPRFSNDFSRLSYHGQTVTYEGALQLAAYLGFKEIYLLGVDCNYNGKKMEHFVKDYVCTIVGDDERDHMIRAYQSARQYADAHGIKIYNVSRGGELEVFERRDFDSLW